MEGKNSSTLTFQGAPPIETTSAIHKDAVKVVVLHPHSGARKMWKFLNENWREFGKREIVIKQINKGFNLDTLVSENPDVIVFSDPAGAPYGFSKQELDDLETFVTTTYHRHLLGTYATFYHQEGHISRLRIYDNRRIAALFGINPKMEFTTTKFSEDINFTIEEKYKNTSLFRDISTPLQSFGYKSTQHPINPGGGWFDKSGRLFGVVPEVELVASDKRQGCVIFQYRTERYTALYISNMPEYESTTQRTDPQFLYNCITYLAGQSSLCSLYGACVRAVSEQLAGRMSKGNKPELITETTNSTAKVKLLNRCIRNDIINEFVLSGRDIPDELEEGDENK